MDKSACLLVILSLIAVLQLSGVNGDQCTDACDSRFPSGPFLVFCSTVGTTHNVSQAALQVQNLLSSSCYAQCDVNFLYPGPCGCPNDCYQDLNRGTCGQTSQVCECQAGWKGKDCSAIKCPANTCSGHGSCISQSASKGGDFCSCQAGWTGYDCSVPVPDILRNYGTLPYGEIASGDPFYANDKYGNAHPFFNNSVVATVKVTLSDSDLAYLLDYNTLYSQDYVPAKLFFSNGELSKSSDITFRVKGSSTRLNVKKSWNVKFPKGDAYKDLKGFAMKANIGDRVVSNQVAFDLYRAMKSTTYRTSMAELFINDVYYGLELLQERMDDNWMKSRWNEKDTNLYKLGPYAMQYLGAETTPYENFIVSIYDGQPQYAIEMEEGDDDFSDFVELVTAFNSSQPVLNNFISGHMDIPVFMRAMALELITKNSDGYTGTGNNFMFMNEMKISKGGPWWNYVGIDYDVAMTVAEEVFAPLFGMTAAQLKAILDSGVTVFHGVNLRAYIMYDNPYEAINYCTKPLMRAFDYPGANVTFTQALKDFVELVIVQNPGVTERYRQAYYDLARPFVLRDKMFTIATGSGVELYDSKSESTKNFLDSRWAYLASLFHANGHGTCNSRGECSCFEGYFGENCNDFCGVSFSQSQTNSWNSDGKQFTQWQVTVNVGSSDLYSAKIQTSTNGASFSAWNFDKVSGSTDLYTFPSYQYSSQGAIPANSNSVTFGYTIGSANPASFRLFNNACVPSATCDLKVSANIVNSWQSNGITYHNTQLSIKNTSPTAAANAQVQISFFGGSYVSSSYNIAPATSAQGESTKNFTCSLFYLQPEQTSTSCGYVLAVPEVLAVNQEVQLGQAVCL